MISGELYYPLYFLMVTLATLYVGFNKGYSKYLKNSEFPIGALLLTVILIVFIGFRPHHRIFTDMSNYILMWDREFGAPFSFDYAAQNIIFDNIFRLMASQKMGITSLFFLMSAIYFGCIFVASYKIFPKNTFFAFVVYLAAFSTLSYGTNGIKAGVASSIFLLAIAYKNNWIISAFFAFLSYGFHHSMEVPIIIFYLGRFVRIQWSLLFWLFCLILAALHITAAQTFFAGLGDEGAAKYMLVDGGGFWVSSSFRFDFVIYSIIPIFIGLWLMRKFDVRDEEYLSLLKLYILCNSFWLLCMYADFSNRIAYLSWFLYPIVLIYPYLKLDMFNGQGGAVYKIALGHLAFSLFMFFIFYGTQYIS